MTTTRAFVALGSNDGDPQAQLAAALAALDTEGCRVAACSRLTWSDYVEPPEGASPPRVLNAVAELRTTLDADALHARLHALEEAAGRMRDGGPLRTLDLDLLTFGDLVRSDAELTLPHPRCLQRAFVLGPWEEIAPTFVVPGTGATVVEHVATLLSRPPGGFHTLEQALPAPFADRAAACEVLSDPEALTAWRSQQKGRIGVVMTMGALHAGHAALVQRAAAECDHVVATVFVNPSQFAPGEDLERYPRTFDADCALLRHHGADAVYAPAVEHLYPDGVVSDVEAGPAAEGYEGAQRPTHFAGVATVVSRLWEHTRADVSYFGRKDAQQLAVLHGLRERMGIDVDVVACPTVREPSGLALSSRNRYLDEEGRKAARWISNCLTVMAWAAALGGGDPQGDASTAREILAEQGFDVDYVDVVNADTMQPVTKLEGPALAIAAARLGDVRLLDNRWIAPPAGSGA